MTACRSALYVPADRPDLCTKAVRSGADAVLVDLEDAVAHDAKATARELLGRWLRELTPVEPELWVRVNPGERALADVEALPLDRLSGLCLAKVCSPADVQRVRAAVSDAGAASMPFEPLIETAAGLLHAPEIAREPDVVRLQLGEADLSADLGVADRDTGLAWARGCLVVASAAAGLAGPLAPVSGDFRDLDRFAETSRGFHGLGYFGRACIHPAQVQVANAVFTPDPAEVARARRLVELFDAHVAQGQGVCVDDDGQLVDEAVVRRSRQLLEVAAR